MQRLDYMSPMEAMAWFQTPTSTQFQNISSAVLIAPADPMRVVIIFGQGSATGSSAVLPSATISNTNSLRLSTSAGPMFITQAEHGLLAQVDWYGIGGAADTITVVELKLREWPTSRKAQREVLRASALATRLGSGRDWGYPVSDGQRETSWLGRFRPGSADE